MTLDDEPLSSKGCGKGVGTAGGFDESGTGGTVCEVWGTVDVEDAIKEADDADSETATVLAAILDDDAVCRR